MSEADGSGHAHAAPSGRRIVIATLTALIVALAVTFGAVLPAEYGLDPLGTGRAFGLLALSQVQPIGASETPYKTDMVELRLAPSEWVESTYRMEEGTLMVYSWEASGLVSYNFHSAPDDAPPGYAQSFDAQESDSAHGSYTAPFSGVHGWYWENLGSDYVTITLTTAGFYVGAHEARDRVSGERPLTDPRGRLLTTPESVVR